MLKRLQKVESHTKFDDHQKEWTQKKRLKYMVSTMSKSNLHGATKQSSKHIGLSSRVSDAKLDKNL